MCPTCCRYATLGQYPLLTGWKEGIVFGNGLKRTEPWSVMERDYKEGMQVSGDDAGYHGGEMTCAPVSQCPHECARLTPALAVEG